MFASAAAPQRSRTVIDAANERQIAFRSDLLTAVETLTAIFTASQITLSLGTHSVC